MRAIVETTRVGLAMTLTEYFTLTFSCGGDSRMTVAEGIGRGTIEALESILGAGCNEVVTRAGCGDYNITPENTPEGVTVWLAPGWKS